MVLESLIGFSAISFLLFGISCFTTAYMQAEFKRYGLARFRVTVGFLQVAGALALVLGLQWNWSLYVGAGGLAILMLLGFLTRLRIKDGFLRAFPSFFYMVINLIIFFFGGKG